MTEAKTAMTTLMEAWDTPRHCLDSAPEIAAVVMPPLAAEIQDRAHGTAYVFADGSVVLIARKDGYTFASVAEMDATLTEQGLA
jgi:hypothetical protein